MDINCKEAEMLMDKVFRGSNNKKAYKKSVKLIEDHCKNCDICKIKYYNFRSTKLNLSQKRIVRITADNQKIEKVMHTRNIFLAFASLLLVISMLIGMFCFITIEGRNVFFASVNYGVAQTFEESTAEHPSFDEVKNAFDISKDYFKEVGRGCILLSLTYNDEYTFSEDFKNSIAIDIKYYRLFVSKNKSGITNFINDEYSVIVTRKDDGSWYAEKLRKTRNRK